MNMKNVTKDLSNLKELAKIGLFQFPTDEDIESLDNLTLQVYSSYALLTSPIPAINKILNSFATKVIRNRTTSQSFYAFPKPTNKKDKHDFYVLLNSLGITSLNTFKINKSHVYISYFKKSPHKNTLWRERLQILQTELQQTIQHLTYTPPTTPKVILSVIPNTISNKRTLDDFLNTFSSHEYPYHQFWVNTLLKHLIYSTSLNKQTLTDKIIANKKDIKPLLPQRLTITDLIQCSNEHCTIKEESKELISFTFHNITSNPYITALNNLMAKDNGLKFIQIPYDFMQHSLAKIKNLPLLLAFLFPFHARYHHYFNYSLQNLATKTNLTKHLSKRGTHYIIERINNCIALFQVHGLISKDIPPVTVEDYKMNKTLKFYFKDIF